MATPKEALEALERAAAAASSHSHAAVVQHQDVNQVISEQLAPFVSRVLDATVGKVPNH